MVPNFRKSMMKNLKSFDEIADQFSDIPMFFMTYFGQEEMHNVIQVNYMSLVMRKPVLGVSNHV